jgi:hypothetical protein
LNAKTNKDSITGILALDRSPSTASSWANSDYFWYFYDDTPDGSRRAMACKNDDNSGHETVLFTMQSPTANDRFAIKFDATNVTWLVNGVEKATTVRISGGEPLFAVVCLGKGTDIGFTDINFTGVGEAKI